MAAAGETTLLLNANRDRTSWLAMLWLVGATGMGQFADGFDLYNIDITMAIIERTHPTQMDPSEKSLVVSSCLVGVIAGMLCFGVVSDAIGRRAAGLVTSSLQLVAAVLSAFCSDALGIGLAQQLALCRLVLGFGIGGDACVSSSLSVEASNSPSFRGRISASPLKVLCLTVLCFKIGMFTASAAALVLALAGTSPDLTWRLCLGAGGLPAATSLLMRALMEEGQAQAHRSEEAAEDGRAAEGGGSQGPPGYMEAFLRNLRHGPVLAAAVVSACYNAMSCSAGSFKSIIAEEIFRSPSTLRGIVLEDARFGMGFGLASILAVLVMLPYVDRLGTRRIALIGFTVAFVCCLTFAVVILVRRPGTWVFLLSALQFVNAGTWGPLALAGFGVVPMNVSAKARAGCFSIGAAAGKAGGLLGSSLFPVVEASWGIQAMMFSCSIVAVVGFSAAAIGYPREDADPRELDKKCC